jgi:SagB-type dehydrogenase family enzyme
MHELMLITHEDKRQALTCAAHSQESIGAAAAVFLLSAVERRTGQKYGSRAARYVHMEAGHAAQNLLLQAAALELGAVVIGAFDDAAVGSVMNLPPGEEPLYLIPVGRR